MKKCQKKSLIDYQKCLTTYRIICCEACVKVSSLKFGNYIFYTTKPTKLWKIWSFIFSSKTVESFWNLYDV